MAFTQPKYPDTLTAGYWEDNRGIIAKKVGDEGIADAAKKAESAYDKVNWGNLSDKKISDLVYGIKTEHELEKFEFVLDELWKAQFHGCTGELAALRSKADKTAKAFKKNPLMPSSATKLAGEIASAAGQFAEDLWSGGKYNKEFLAAFDGQIKAHRIRLEKSKKLLERVPMYLVALKVGLESACKSHDQTEWNKDVLPPGQALNDIMSAIPLLEDHRKTLIGTFHIFNWSKLFGESDGEALAKKIEAVKTDFFKEMVQIIKLIKA